MHDLEAIIRKRRRQDAAMNALGALATVGAIAVLGVLLAGLIRDGASRIDWQFLTSFPSRRPERAGILSAWVGSALLMLVCALTAIPLGIAAGVYLEEYARKNRLTAAIEVNIANLAGVPSIIYGLMALGLLVHGFKVAGHEVRLGTSVATGGITLGMLILPIVIVATREAIRGIPRHMREAAYALGATRWQVVKHHVLPYSGGGISTGVIIALSRAIGETAPLVPIGALTYIAFLPDPPVAFPEGGGVKVQPAAWLNSPFTALPIQMFNWVSRPGDDFLRNAAAAGLVLILATLLLNTGAILVRARMRRRIKW
jgi:phosphate transport system permease protein